jgi:hypothetical protein
MEIMETMETMETTNYTDVINNLITARIRNSILNSFNHIACFISKNNTYHEIIGFNSDKSQFGNSFIKTHAEIDAVQKIRYYMKCKIIKRNKMDLIVLRLNKYGKLCQSAPCYHCTCFLNSKKTKQLVKINKIYYSNQNETITAINFNDWVKYQNCNKHVSKCWKKWVS